MAGRERVAMEPIFEITAVQSKEVLRRTAARILRTRLVIHTCLWMLAGTAFALFVLLRGMEEVYSFAAVLWMSCAGFSYYRFQSVPRKYAERTYSNTISLYREPVTLKIRVYRDALTVENRQQRTLHRYLLSECGPLLEEPELFLLQTNKKTYITMEKAGFTLGTAEDFRRFYLEQGKNL